MRPPFAGVVALGGAGCAGAASTGAFGATATDVCSTGMGAGDDAADVAACSWALFFARDNGRRGRGLGCAFVCVVSAVELASLVGWLMNSYFSRASGARRRGEDSVGVGVGVGGGAGSLRRA